MIDIGHNYAGNQAVSTKKAKSFGRKIEKQTPAPFTEFGIVLRLAPLESYYDLKPKERHYSTDLAQTMQILTYFNNDTFLTGFYCTIRRP